MRLVLKKKSSDRLNARKKRKVRVRKKIMGAADRLRLSVFRSTSHIYAQLIDDASGVTVASASSLKLGSLSGKEQAAAVGKALAEIALKKNVSSVVFDRGGYVYHGRVKALAEGARAAGLKF